MPMKKKKLLKYLLRHCVTGWLLTRHLHVHVVRACGYLYMYVSSQLTPYRLIALDTQLQYM